MITAFISLVIQHPLLLIQILLMMVDLFYQYMLKYLRSMTNLNQRVIIRKKISYTKMYTRRQKTMKERIEVLLSAEEIDSKLSELAETLYQEFGDEQVELVCALKGAVVVTVDLAKKMKMPVTLNFMSVSSYGDSTVSSGNINVKMDLDEDIEGKNVLIVEDIIDTGRTLKKLKELLLFRKPKNLKIVTLLDKPDRRVADISADYVGFTIPDAFVVGYGLDYAQKYRHLPYVGVVHFDED